MAASTRLATARRVTTAMLAIKATPMMRPLATESTMTEVLVLVGRGDICVAAWELRRPDVRQQRDSVYVASQQVSPLAFNPVEQQLLHGKFTLKQFWSAVWQICAIDELGATTGGVTTGGVTTNGGTTTGGVNGGTTTGGVTTVGGTKTGGVTKLLKLPVYTGPFTRTSPPCK